MPFRHCVCVPVFMAQRSTQRCSEGWNASPIEDRLGQSELFSPENRRLRGDLIAGAAGELGRDLLQRMALNLKNVHLD